MSGETNPNTFSQRVALSGFQVSTWFLSCLLMVIFHYDTVTMLITFIITKCGLGYSLISLSILVLITQEHRKEPKDVCGLIIKQTY